MWPFGTRQQEQRDQKEQHGLPNPEIKPARYEMSLLAQASRTAPHIYQAWKTLCVTQRTTTVRRLRELVDQEMKDLGENGDIGDFVAICQQTGTPPGQRVVEMMEQDLLNNGQEILAQAGHGGTGTMQDTVMEAVRRANKEIDDSFTAAEVAREMGIRVQELSSQFLGQVAELTVALSDVSAKYSDVVRKFQTAPDFIAWTEKMNEVLTMSAMINKQQRDMIDRMEMIISNQNAITDLLKGFQERVVQTVTNNVIGRLGEQIERDLEPLKKLDAIETMKKSLADLIIVNNKIVELLEKKK